MNEWNERKGKKREGNVIKITTRKKGVKSLYNNKDFEYRDSKLIFNSFSCHIYTRILTIYILLQYYTKLYYFLIT